MAYLRLFVASLVMLHMGVSPVASARREDVAEVLDIEGDKVDAASQLELASAANASTAEESMGACKTVHSSSVFHTSDSTKPGCPTTAKFNGVTMNKCLAKDCCECTGKTRRVRTNAQKNLAFVSFCCLRYSDRFCCCSRRRS